MSAAQVSASAAETARDNLQAELNAALTDVTAKEVRVTELEKNVAASTSLRAELSSARNERERWRETAETYQGEIMEMEDALRSEIGELEQKLS